MEIQIAFFSKHIKNWVSQLPILDIMATSDACDGASCSRLSLVSLGRFTLPFFLLGSVGCVIDTSEGGVTRDSEGALHDASSVLVIV